MVFTTPIAFVVTAQFLERKWGKSFVEPDA